MIEGRDIAALSVPFVAGVAGGTAISGIPGISVGGMSLACASTCSASLLLLILIASTNPGRIWYSALYLAAGLFCAFNASISPIPCTGWRIPDEACAFLHSTIGDMQFSAGECGPVVKALLTGDRSSLDKEIVRTFREAGAAHILALSGLHMSVIYTIIRRLGFFAGNSPKAKAFRMAATICATGFYTIMTGAGPSCVRAWLFICISESASIAPGRKKNPGRVLSLCLTIQLALKPGVIASTGFQLSYLAMCGIVFVLPHLRECYPAPDSAISKWDPMRRIWNAAALALSCQLFTAPLSWFKFHTFPRYFLIANLLALPLSTAVMGVSVFAVAAEALGSCPPWLLNADELCIKALLFVLKTISGMQG